MSVIQLRLGSRNPQVPPQGYTFPLCSAQLLEYTGASSICSPILVGERPGWARMGWLCRAELLRRMRLAADRSPQTDISHSDDQQRVISSPCPRPAEKSSEELKPTSRFASTMDLSRLPVGSGGNQQPCFSSSCPWLKSSGRDAITHAPNIWAWLSP